MCKWEMPDRPSSWEEKYIVTRCSWNNPVSINFFETQKDYNLSEISTTPLLKNAIKVPLKFCNNMPHVYIKDLCYQKFFNILSNKNTHININSFLLKSSFPSPVYYEDVVKIKDKKVLIMFSAESKDDIQIFKKYGQDKYKHDKDGKFIDEIIRKGDPGDNYYPYYDFYQKGNRYYFTVETTIGEIDYNDRFQRILGFFFNLPTELQESINLQTNFVLEKEYKVYGYDLEKLAHYLQKNIGYIIQPNSSNIIARSSNLNDQFSLKTMDLLRAFNSRMYLQPEKITLQNNKKLYSVKFYLTQEDIEMVNKFFTK